MKMRTKKLLQDAFTACQLIEEFVADHTLSDYEQNLLLRSAVERQFEIVGEALHQAEIVDQEVTERIPELRRIVGLRNRIIHGYDSVDDELLWQTIQRHIPTLRNRLENLLTME
jgi:uncharacterized protein with HEPN domain